MSAGIVLLIPTVLFAVPLFGVSCLALTAAFALLNRKFRKKGLKTAAAATGVLAGINLCSICILMIMTWIRSGVS